jgi:hypothetical protein
MLQYRYKTEMPEYRNTEENVSPASLVLPLVRHVSPASAFRHWLQSGTADHGLFRQCPAMVMGSLFEILVAGEVGEQWTWSSGRYKKICLKILQ